MNHKEMPEISVIVPVYKVEEYLSECVDSILNQSFESFELILVDDGSPDRSREICDRYAEADRRVHVIHKSNGGLSDARNKGIDAARGRYVTFIDSDDIVYVDYLRCLYDAAQKYDADIVQGNLTYRVEQLGMTGTDRHRIAYSERVFTGEESIRDYLTYTTHFSNSTFKLFKRDLFEGVRFPIGKYSEDEYLTYRTVLKSKRDVCLPIYIYYYRMRSGSIVHSYTEKRFNVCNELPALIEKDVQSAGYDCKAELDYKNMRIQLKIYNDFIQGGQYKKFKSSLRVLENRIKKIQVEKSIWERKYIVIRFAISYFPALYRFIVRKFRNEGL